MATPKEIDKEQANRLHELLIIKKHNKGHENMLLDIAISSAKAAMTKEAIAWVEKNISELDKP